MKGFMDASNHGDLPCFRPKDGHKTQQLINMSITWTTTRNWQYIPGLCRLCQLNNNIEKPGIFPTSSGTVGTSNNFKHLKRNETFTIYTTVHCGTKRC
jgi:hypothetical protein